MRCRQENGLARVDAGTVGVPPLSASQALVTPDRRAGARPSQEQSGRMGSSQAAHGDSTSGEPSAPVA